MKFPVGVPIDDTGFPTLKVDRETLRDFFAGVALLGATIYAARFSRPEEVNGKNIVHDAYAMADLMMQEREKGGGK